MKSFTQIYILLFIFLLTGCVGYRHSRTVSLDGTKKESTSLVTLFKKGEAGLISSEVYDAGYSRKVGLSEVKTSGDPETIGAAVEAGKAFAYPPMPPGLDVRKRPDPDGVIRQGPTPGRLPLY